MFVVCFLLEVALLLVFGGSAFAFEYAWLTDTEVRVFGDLPVHDDALTFGVTRSNSAVCVGGIVYDLVISADTICGEAEYRGPQPVERAPVYPFPETLGYLRNNSMHYDYEGMNCFVDIGGSSMRIHHWPIGTPIDTLENPEWMLLPLMGNDIVFFDNPIQIKGRLTGQLVIGCSQDIGIVDNLTYVDANVNGEPGSGSANYMVIASERDIKIRNTPANGRENCNGGGRDNPNQTECGIIISAHLVALNGSFTFENQNDPDSGYVCDCSPDERGYVHLFGSIAQRQAGYVHRSNNNGTGYLKDYRFDARSQFMPDYVFFPPTAEASTDTLDFGDVELGETVRDTAHVYRYYDYQYYGAYATYPFVLGQVTPTYGNHFRLPIQFTPHAEGVNSGVLTVILEGDPVEIVLRGRGVRNTALNDAHESVPRVLALRVTPNPFNSEAELRYELSSPEAATLRMLDGLGRVVNEWSLGNEPSGTLHIDGKHLSSGLYFLSLTQTTQRLTQKILVIK